MSGTANARPDSGKACLAKESEALLFLKKRSKQLSPALRA
jgi:hypothetical protein